MVPWETQLDPLQEGTENQEAFQEEVAFNLRLIG